ncbi:Mpo1-like protein [Piscinibacter sp. XHJ-5]|uniref:Mpo1-like protein n=1 Tax=Piscinibacter sp. XHJ-5 TaxID=3037797 RepID=UPI0024529950|nr:Mpo1-like protein [Piscinibacter sp. XHJ-5]
MNVSELLRWQWDGYTRYHGSRFNLLLHIVVVPLFLVGNVVLLAALAQRAWPAALGGAVAMVVSVALQGRGHRAETLPPEPFTGPLNAISRIFLEQWVTFPRFVLSGHWMKAWRHASAS